MLGLGWSEIFIIVVVALLVIGPDKLPEVVRGVAKVFRQLQRMANDVRYTLDAALQEPPPRPPTPSGDEGVAAVRRPAPTTDGQPTHPKPESPAQD